MVPIYSCLQTYGTPGKVNPLVLHPLRRVLFFVATLVRRVASPGQL